MQLRDARLCLDCEEVHAAQQCPTCASETFAFLTRWVPSPERAQHRPRPPQVADAEALGTYREMLEPGRQPVSRWKTLRRGAVGVAILGLAGWIWRHQQPPEAPAQPGEGDEGGPPQASS